MSFIQPRLLKFCYPELWIPVDALPCTLTGKLNRKHLRDFFHGLSPSTQNELAMLSTAPKRDACSAAQVACRLGTGISEGLILAATFSCGTVCKLISLLSCDQCTQLTIEVAMEVKRSGFGEFRTLTHLGTPPQLVFGGRTPC
ncbi:hypothetical protein BKA82DRAFT_4515020 [Pisolithus tinctorius]|nr:hypothetical protein BKA82DRAFT_4515020 [Pisolithus tinctorius]